MHASDAAIDKTDHRLTEIVLDRSDQTDGGDDEGKTVGGRKQTEELTMDWGLSIDIFASFESKMANFEKLRSKNTATTYEKYIARMQQQKQTKLEAEMSSRIMHFRSDFTLRIELVIKAEDGSYRPLNPIPVWRRIKCSGGLTLRQFQDRVLIPALGWARNYHSYIFFDPSDGSQWGPSGSRHADALHTITRGIHYSTDLEIKLAQLLQCPGEYIYCLYDLGDGFLHRITLDSVDEPARSTSSVKLIDGSGACPPEDSIGLSSEGCPGFEAVSKFQRQSKEVHAIQELCAQALNYSDLPLFDPVEWDIDKSRQAIATALKGSASVPSGAKIFYTRILDGSFLPEDSSRRISPYFTQEDSKEGLVTVTTDTTYRELKHPIFELVRCKKDPVVEAMCMTCGSPHDLSYCSKCNWATYCSQACQRKGWKEGGHKAECNTTGLRPLPPNPKLRFQVGDLVECSMDAGWERGTIVKCEYREPRWASSNPTAAYQVEISTPKGTPYLIYAPMDDNPTIRRAKISPSTPTR